MFQVLPGEAPNFGLIQWSHDQMIAAKGPRIPTEKTLPRVESDSPWAPIHQRNWNLKKKKQWPSLDSWWIAQGKITKSLVFVGWDSLLFINYYIFTIHYNYHYNYYSLLFTTIHKLPVVSSLVYHWLNRWDRRLTCFRPDSSLPVPPKGAPCTKDMSKAREIITVNG